MGMAGKRLRYWFDNTMSRGTPALIGWLAAVTAVMVLVFSLVTLLVSPHDADGARRGLFGTIWAAFMHSLDPGTLAGDTGGVPFLAVMLAVTFGGIMIVSALIGVLTTGLDARLEELRKGRSLVLETDHTLILGWSDQVFTIVSELALANANRRRPRVVILAGQDKLEMEEALRKKIPDTGTTRVVCRSGSPMDLDDLDIVNPTGARSIVVLGGDGDDPDAEVIKTLLAITNSPRRKQGRYHIVAEIRDPRNTEVARLAGNGEALVVDTGDIAARLIVQTCRQSGLSVVYTELLDYGGDELYILEEPRLVGARYADALLAYRTSALMGLQLADGRIALNPPMETRIKPGDKVIAISEDDDTVVLSEQAPAVVGQAINVRPPRPPAPEHTLLLGWNERAAAILRELDGYVAPGSVAHVVADVEDLDAELLRAGEGLRNLEVGAKQDDITDRRTLDAISIGSYQHVVVLSGGAGNGSEAVDPDRADARTLVTLLHLRDMQAKAGVKYSIVSEMHDDRNRRLAEVTKADDFIVSDKLISLLLTQVSENAHLHEVFGDLFDPEGSEIYLKPVEDYVRTDHPLTFWTLVAAAQIRGESAIGYRLAANAADPDQAYGVVINPDKGEPLRFAPGDKLIVLAED
jgi:voltage-gated potassium channel Kch